MKKMIPLLLALAMILSLCACGANAPKTISKATEAADKQLDSWNKTSYNGYKYLSSYRDGIYLIIMRNTDGADVSLLPSVVEGAAKEAYTKSAQTFSNVEDGEVTVAIVVQDENKNNLYLYDGNSLHDYDDVMG